ncbi:hypothetical protein AO066_27670 [Pseudomonas fluorescens]|nr:hypothetical protein AO066_27670 [Pseudomonas fluorescens]RMP74337.1 hypothetical protein ALQ17_02921 [Pseudomonas fluorescens]
MSAPTSPPAPIEQGQHYALIKQAIAPCLSQASPSRRLALKQTPAQIPDWYAGAAQPRKDQIKALLDARCSSLNELEKSLAKLQSVTAFAQPLLEAALKQAGFELDVNQTWLRLYYPVEDAFGVATGSFRTKTFSLLQAALNNFEAREAEAGFFNASSGFITTPDARGHFERHPTTLKIETFARLCRGLDLGAKYQAHLKSFLQPQDAVAEGVLRERYLKHQKAAFEAAACLALLKGDIDDSDHALLMRVLAGEPQIMLGDKQVWYRVPCLMNLRLQDCLVIDPCVKYRYSTWVIVYIPDDPDHPIKRYASYDAFSNAMTDRLKAGPGSGADRSQVTAATDYQRFISQFVAYQHRPYYFRRLTELVLDAPPQPFALQWIRSEWGQYITELFSPPAITGIASIFGDPEPQVHVPITAPEFDVNAASIKGLWEEVDLWPHRYENLRTRLYADARAQAVSTADADKAERSRRLEHYLNIGLFGVNLLGMVIPPLGVVMSLVTAGQLLYEVLDGAIDWAQGDREAGWAHITDVIENLALLAIGATVSHLTLSPFIEQLKAVQLPGGKTRLWKPDLSAYEHPSPLPQGSVADVRGLHRVGGKQVLELEGRRYAVQQDAETEGYHVVHPTRSDVYQPRLTANGSGAWNHELEQPLRWRGATLMRRLGPVMEGFSDVELEQIRRVSGVEADRLRRVHAEGEPVPAILLDTVRQFRAYHDAVAVAEGIGQGRLSSALCSFPASLVTELSGWPEHLALEAYSDAEPRSVSAKYGYSKAIARDTLRISRMALMRGELPAAVIGFLSEAQTHALLPGYTPRTPELRIGALRKRLQDFAVSQRARLMRSLYAEQQPTAQPATQLITRQFPRVPALMAEELLVGATRQELRTLNTDQRVPLRIAEAARQAQQQMRLAHAYEGLYLEALADKDTEVLALNTLQSLPGWKDDLRLEVRDGELEGELRASFGAEDASERKVLVRVGEGRYQARNIRDETLHETEDLYAALQHALTDAHRRAIGLPSIKQGPQLKAKIVEGALPRDQLRPLLKMQQRRYRFADRPSMRLPGGRLGYRWSNHGQDTAWGRIVEERVRSLYPTLTSEQVSAFVDGLGVEQHAKLKALELEYKTFDNALQNWLREHVRQVSAEARRSGAFLHQRRARLRIVRALREAWRRTGSEDLDISGYSHGQVIDLSGEDLFDQLEELPLLTVNFDHVSALELSGAGIETDPTPFLRHFKRLRRLGLESNELTVLPEAIGQMLRLTALDLSENQIVLDAHAVDHLKGLTQLNYLGLESNPLLLAPDIGRMPDLSMLLLGDTGLHTWPPGLFDQPRARSFVLDLSANRLDSVPQVDAGSSQANIVARTRISSEPQYISAQNLDVIRGYRQSVGLEPDRPYPPRGVLDSIHWRTGLSDEQWLAKQPVWDSLEHEHGSEPFFNELRKLSESADTLEEGAAKADLTRKVWTMIETAAAHRALREKLFIMAAAPTTCVDAGAQLFNAMGVEVLVAQAYELVAEDLVERQLLELARGKSRLDELGRIAHGRVSELVAQGRKFPEYDADGHRVTHRDAEGNVMRDIDEVEIYLIYATELASEDKLDLPWQSAQMMFQEPDVTPAMIEQARVRVLALEEGDLLRKSIGEQPFWLGFLKQSNPGPFQALQAEAEAAFDRYATSEPARFEAEMANLATQDKALVAKLTGQALDRARLPLIGAPFVV